jgi:superfamily I DNA and/or RNA helicase
VTAGSNSACDEVGERLLDYIESHDLLRFYSSTLMDRTEDISQKLIPFSNIPLQNKKVPYEEIKKARVVISTIGNSGRLLSLSPDHFDFIFIDECASVAEAFVNVPISLAMGSNGLSASIVLLGDPKQLGPIVKSKHTEEYDKLRYDLTSCYSFSLSQVWSQHKHDGAHYGLEEVSVQ